MGIGFLQCSSPIFNVLLQWSSLLFGLLPSVLSINVMEMFSRKSLWSSLSNCLNTRSLIHVSFLVNLWSLYIYLKLLVVPPTYCFLNWLHVSWYVKHMSSQSSLWFTLYVLIVTVLANKSIFEILTHILQFFHIPLKYWQILNNFFCHA